MEQQQTDRHLILVLEDHPGHLHIRFMTETGELVSHNTCSADADIAEIIKLIESLTYVLGGYKRVLYFKNFQNKWDYAVPSNVFSEFLEELLASQYHSPMYTSSDFKYCSFEHFPVFLRDHYKLVRVSTEPFGPDAIIIYDDELPI